MSDWLPQIVRIEDVVKPRDADALDVVTVLGDHQVVVKRGEYKVGDTAAYVPIDSIVPDTQEFYFLCPKLYEKYEENGEVKQRQLGPKYPVGGVPEKYRIIKAKKIRGIYSQGMLVNLGWLNDARSTGPGGMGSMMGLGTYIPYHVGDSVVEYLQLKKWEEEEEENLPGLKKTRGANAEKAPQGWAIPHYDIDGLRKYLSCLLPDEQIVLTEKIHGSNAAFVHDGERLWVKSRNFYKKMDPDDMWWDIAIRYDIENKLAAHPMEVFFGEIAGQIKGFRYDSKIENGQLLTVIHFFDIWDTQKMRYLDYDDRVTMIRSVGLSPVPELYKGVWLGKEKMYPYAEGMSTLNLKHIREGFILNTLKERYESKLDSRMQVKLVGESYSLLK